MFWLRVVGKTFGIIAIIFFLPVLAVIDPKILFIVSLILIMLFIVGGIGYVVYDGEKRTE